MRLTLFGPFKLEVAGQPRLLPTRKSEALLAYLALRGDRAHGRDWLASLLWGDVAPEQARHSLRQALTRVRRAVEGTGRPVIVTAGDTVQLAPDTVEVDVLEFRALADSRDPAALARAAQLYRGELLEGLHLNEVRFDNWLSAERTRLHHAVTEVLLVQLRQAVGVQDTALAVATATSLLELDPTQEHVHRVLMQLYREQGRHGSALQQYNVCARILQQELGVEPDPATRQLCQDILVERARGVAPFPAPAPGRRAASAPAAVLVMEPNPVTRATLERTLSRAGYPVVLAPRGASLPEGAEGAFAAVVSGFGSMSARLRLLARLRSQDYEGTVLFITDTVPRTPARPSGRIRVGYLRRPVRGRALLEALRAAVPAPVSARAAASDQ